MLVADTLALSVCFLLMFFIVSVVRIEDIAYLTDLVFEMDGVDLRIMQLRIWLMCQLYG